MAKEVDFALYGLNRKEIGERKERKVGYYQKGPKWLERLLIALILFLVAIAVVAIIFALGPEYGNIISRANDYFLFQDVIQ